MFTIQKWHQIHKRCRAALCRKTPQKFVHTGCVALRRTETQCKSCNSFSLWLWI